VAITGFALTGYYGVALKKAGDDLTEAELQHETFDCSAPGSNLRQECRRAQDHLDAARRQRHRSSDAVVATAIVGSLGVAILLVGTIRYATAVQREAREDRAWIRVRPALGGLLVQGRF
jgi:hypothetical protein